jgi:hypothetical protein
LAAGAVAEADTLDPVPPCINPNFAIELRHA